MASDNDGAIEAWNTVLFDKFVRFRRIVTDGFAEHGARPLRERPYAAGASVLDVGCGFGDTTLVIAEQVFPTTATAGTSKMDFRFTGAVTQSFPVGNPWTIGGNPFQTIAATTLTGVTVGATGSATVHFAAIPGGGVVAPTVNPALWKPMTAANPVTGLF